MLRAINRFIHDKAGATAIEYGLIAAAVSLTIIAILPQLRSQLNATFSDVTKGMQTIRSR